MKEKFNMYRIKTLKIPKIIEIKFTNNFTKTKIFVFSRVYSLK